MILVTGSTGKCGREVVSKLAERGAPVRALVRDPDRGASLAGDGVDLAVGDFESPETIRAACEGIDSLFLLSSQHPNQAEFQGNVVDAAKDAGVSRIVKVSAGTRLMGAGSPSFVGRQHTETEERIEAAGLGYTFLRPNWFMENLLVFADPVRAKGILPLAVVAGETRMAPISVEDIAAVAAEVLLRQGADDGKVYDLTGPEALTASEVGDRLTSAWGRKIEVIDPPVEAMLEGLRAKGAPDWLQQHMLEVRELFRDGAGEDLSEAVEEITGRRPRSLEEFAKANAGAFVP